RAGLASPAAIQSPPGPRRPAGPRARALADHTSPALRGRALRAHAPGTAVCAPEPRLGLPQLQAGCRGGDAREDDAEREGHDGEREDELSTPAGDGHAVG